MFDVDGAKHLARPTVLCRSGKRLEQAAVEAADLEPPLPILLTPSLWSVCSAGKGGRVDSMIVVVISAANRDAF